MIVSCPPRSSILGCVLLGACLLLSACASKDLGKATKAATSPFSDLNLIREAIPPVLRAARRAPYARPQPMDCAAVQSEIAALDEALGPDLDTPPSKTNPSLLERGVDYGKDSVVQAVGRTAQDVVPFRGWVRKLSGAERHSREVTAAITAGGIRRGYLKGLRAAHPCGLAPPPTGEPAPPAPEPSPSAVPSPG